MLIDEDGKDCANGTSPTPFPAKFPPSLALWSMKYALGFLTSVDDVLPHQKTDRIIISFLPVLGDMDSQSALGLIEHMANLVKHVNM